MKISSYTTYTCEICNHPWSTKEFAEKCEAIGYPENYNKLLGKWIIVPASVYFSEEKAKDSFNFTPKKLWRVVRIDSNYLTNLTPGLAVPTGVTALNSDEGESDAALEMERKYSDMVGSIHHRLVVQCKGFEDNSRVESLKTYFNVPEGLFQLLNDRLVQMEIDRVADKKEAAKSFGDVMTKYIEKFFTSHTFEARQHREAEEVLALVMAEAGKEIGELPAIVQEELPSISIEV